MRRVSCWLVCLSFIGLAAGCSPVAFDRPGATMDDAAYTALFPTYAEFCALSQILKKPGFGADIRGEIGGHSVFFLQGACRAAGAYPGLEPCDGGGAGLSMNAHFRNASWVATPGRSLFFDGGLPPGAPVDRTAYAAVQARAKAAGLYDGVRFWPEAFAPGTAGMAPEDAKYEMSVGTDYGVALARGRHCVRIPVSRTQMNTMIAWLNAQNEPYRTGRAEFHWSVFTDNCIHLAHNALAAAGLWAPWPTHRPLLVSVFDFPVPRNEFINMARRANAPLPTLAALAGDGRARAELEDTGALTPRPGALAVSVPPHRPNTVYDTGNLKMIFYDEPNFGHYQQWSDALFGDPAALDLDANLRTWQARLRDARASLATEPLPEGDPAALAALKDRYGAFLAVAARDTAGRLAELEETHGP